MSKQELLISAKHELEMALKSIERRTSAGVVALHIDEAHRLLSMYFKEEHLAEAQEVLKCLEEAKQMIGKYALMLPYQSSLPLVMFGEKSIPYIALSMIGDKLKQARDKLSKLC